VLIAAALSRWSGSPVQWWLRTTAVLTAVSLVPPVLAAADAATAATLVALHLLAAAVVVPVVARALGAGEAVTRSPRRELAERQDARRG
jgi:hypothetical protein